MENITLISNAKNWIEHDAITQLQSVATLNGVIKAVGLPDLHPGRSPIGIAIETKDVFYPHIIGNDIGCGMELFSTGISLKQYKQDRWVSKLNHIRSLEDLSSENPYLEDSPILDLGTIGGGNHFAEFQAISSIENKEKFEMLHLDKTDVLLLIHSGSRGYGQSILSEFLNYNGLAAKSTQGQMYIAMHNDAVLWAERNRNVVANTLVDYLGFSKKPEVKINCIHNFLEVKEDHFIHRKGAVSSDNEFIVIPGSRGSLSYIVIPVGNKELSLHSLSHGAGRKWARSLCKGRIKNLYTGTTIRETKYKSAVVCHDTKLLYEEAPQAYKNIETVIEILLEYGLIEIIATLKPLITFKG